MATEQPLGHACLAWYPGVLRRLTRIDINLAVRSRVHRLFQTRRCGVG